MLIKLKWLYSLRAQSIVLVALIFFISVGSLAYTVYSLRLRQHDYLILNLTGQLRVLSQTMLDQAQQYQRVAPDDYDKYNRDLATYWQGLQQQMALYERIIKGLSQRQLDAGLAGDHGTIYCTFDAFSRNQLAVSARDWQRFARGLNKAIGDDLSEPKLTWAAHYISANGNQLISSSEKLSYSFQKMMEARLDQVRFFLLLALISASVLILLILWVTQRGIIRPIKNTLKGFDQVAKGDFKHQVPVYGQNEIAQMASAFNQLTARLNAMFNLTNRINQGTQLDEMLVFVHQSFQAFVPLDWVGVLYPTPDGGFLSLERFYSEQTHALKEGDLFTLPPQFLTKTLAPVAIDLSTCAPATIQDLTTHLAKSGLQSAAYLPLLAHSGTPALMVFASHQVQYNQDHIDFLSNIAATISHVLEKTLVLESLVTAAIQGLAKLAESRDPETGDHLNRMALYSAIVAEALNHNPRYSSQITPAYIRDIFHFAPMHDIGKVGIADRILLKPAGLTDAERSEMQFHPTIGGEVLRRAEAQVAEMGYSMFKVGIEIAEGHHEKFDGSGYPAGLKGEEIPLSARIVAVADVFDALTSKRPYKEAWPVDRALNAMQNDAGKHFDPEVMDALQVSLPRILEVYEKFKHV
jgi:response regulator RpfG family c-di-GMP phosphodiesterase/HAMP domain-containing protein